MAAVYFKIPEVVWSGFQWSKQNEQSYQNINLLYNEPTYLSLKLLLQYFTYD